MFKYTANPEVLRQFTSIQKNSKKPWDDHYFLAVSITGSSSAYFACGNFWEKYNSYEFYSTTPRTKVPLNGVLIPVEWFTVTEDSHIL